MRESRSIDLHQRTVAEAIREFARFYHACSRSGYRGRIEVIHGYGSTGGGGAIRQQLRKYLAAHAETYGPYLAGDSLGNPGVTIVYASGSSPTGLDSRHSAPPLDGAQEAIRRFCDGPKSKERILTKLRGRFGDRVLSAEIRAMVQSGALAAVETGDGVVLYKAAGVSG